MFSPIPPPLLNAQIPVGWLEWSSPTDLSLAIAVGFAVAVAVLTWRVLLTFEAAPRKRHGARVHAFDRAS